VIFLIDNQLPIGLVEHLRGHGLDAVHVSQCALEKSSDIEIWEYARTNDYVIVTKDEDFFHLSGCDKNGPPVVWVRLGNCRNSVLFSVFDTLLVRLLQAIEDGSKVVEIR